MSWTLISRPLAACVTFTAAGDFTYTLAGGQYAGVILTDPELRASVSRYDAATSRCAGPKALAGLSMAQHWAGYACGFTPSMATTEPWQAAHAAWPGCADRDQALMTDTYDVRASSYTQYDSGAPLPLGTFGAAAACFGVYATASLREGNLSDTFTAGNYPSAGKACLPG